MKIYYDHPEIQRILILCISIGTNHIALKLTGVNSLWKAENFLYGTPSLLATQKPRHGHLCW